MKTFQDYWDRQIKRLEKHWTPTELNMIFDECKESYEAGFQYYKYLKNQCACEPFQSGEKCKTEWIYPTITPPKTLKKYWVLRVGSNMILKGATQPGENTKRFHLKGGGSIDFKDSMYAEIKPPATP